MSAGLVEARKRRMLGLSAAVLTLAGLALRIFAARGDLWLDEVHSLALVASIHRPDEVFWNINHDNNHFLNSLFLFLIGPDHSSVVLRLEAIGLGTLSIPAAGLAAVGSGRRSIKAAILAMLFCAFLYPSVHFGSEARGYSGLVLFTFLAIHRLEAGIETPRQQLLFGVIILMGLLSHLLMVTVLGALFVWRMSVSWRPGQDIFVTLAIIAGRFWAAWLLAATLGACVIYGRTHHSFIRGADVRSTPHELFLGNARFFDYTFGLPVDHRIWIGWVATMILFSLHLFRSRPDESARSLLYMTFLVLYPAWMLLSGGDDFHQPRYSMPMLAPLILLLADAGALAWGSGGAVRVTMAAILLLIAAGTARELSLFFKYGRGQYAAAVADMTSAGPAVYGSDVKYGHSQVVDYYAAREDVSATFVPFNDWCVVPPQWLIHTDAADPHPPRLEMGPSRCGVRFVLVRFYPHWGFSGWDWALYRRENGVPVPSQR